VPLEKVEFYSEKYKRSVFSIRSKIHKIRTQHQDRLEAELDTIFIKKPSEKKVIELHEVKDYLIDFLTRNAKNGVEQNELRSMIPKRIVPSEHLAKVITELEYQKAIAIKKMPAIQLDPVSASNYSKEVQSLFKSVLKTKFNRTIVHGVFSLETLFEARPDLKEKFLVSEFLNVKPMNFIFWCD
jgi:hypothetical protein